MSMAQESAAAVTAGRRASHLTVSGLQKRYGARQVVHDVHLGVGGGEVVGLLGPNGAGKTTSFYMIVGLVRPNGGRVFFNGQDVTDLAMYKRARMGMGYLPQEESIFRKLTVEDNIMAILETTDMGKAERKARCEELLEQFGIAHVRKQLALTLSGGEKRRLTIARSLVTNPSLLMLDEPVEGLAPVIVEEIVAQLKMIKQAGVSILLVEQNLEVCTQLADRHVIIEQGRVVYTGSNEAFRADDAIKDRYLGVGLAA